IAANTLAFGLTTFSASVFDFLTVSGDAAFSKSTHDTIVLSSGDVITADVLTLGMENISTFVGYGGVGVRLTDVDLAVAFISEQGGAERSWKTVKGNIDDASFEGVSGLGLTVHTAAVEINKQADDGTVVDYKVTGSETQATVLDVPVSATTTVIFDFDDDNGDYAKVTGNVDIDVFGLVTVSGSFAVEKRSNQSIVLDSGDVVTADLLTIGMADVNAFVGYGKDTPDELGISLTDVDLAIALWSEVGGTGRGWTTVKASVGSATFEGVTGLGLIVNSAAIEVNKAASSDQTLVDYHQGDGETQATNLSVAVGTGQTVAFDIDDTKGDYLQLVGNVTIDIFGLASVTGDYGVEKSSNRTIALSDDTTATANLLTIGLANVDTFVGFGGIGIQLLGINLAIALWTESTPGTRKWTSVKAGVTSASFQGVPNLSINNITAAIEVNKAAADGTVVDYHQGTGETVFTDLSVVVGPGQSVPLDMDDTQGDYVRLTGSGDINLFDLVTITGAFGVEKNTGRSIVVSDYGSPEARTSVTADLLTIGLSNVDTFIGYDGIGLDLDTVDVAIALWSEVGGAGRSWTSVMASVGSASFVGVTDLVMTVTNTKIVINKQADDGTVVDYVQTAGENSVTSLSVTVAQNETVIFNIDDDKGDYAQVTGSVDIDIFGLIDVSGDFGAEKRTNQSIALSGGGSATANLLSLGLSNVSAFLGYGEDTADEIGLDLAGMNIAIALWSEVGGTSRKWTSVQATIGTATLVGIPGLTATATGFGIEVNKKASDNTLVDYDTQNLVVPVGPSTNVTFTLDGDAGEVLRAFGGLTLGIDNFVTVSGNFGVEKQSDATSSKLLIGAASISTFFGTPDESMGVRITNAGFGMVLIQGTGGANKYALTASGSAALVGFDDILDLSATLAVRVNKTGAAVDESIVVGKEADGTPITVDIDFADGADVIGLYGAVDLTVVDFVTISGAFGFEKQVDGTTTKLLIGAAGIDAFMGVGLDTPNDPDDDLGIKVASANLGLVLIKDGAADATYALDASGSAALVGLPGLQIDGSLSVRINETGQVVDETVHTSGDDVEVKFTTAESIKVFSGHIILSVTNIFTLEGDITAIQRGNGTVLIDIPNVSLNITKCEAECDTDTPTLKEIFSISAAARFSISPADGFHLMDLRVTGFSILGTAAASSPNYDGDPLEMFEAGLETATLPPGSNPNATLEYPLNDGQIDLTNLNSRKYIDITFNDYSGQGLDLTTITDANAEFALSGAGLADAQLSSIEHLHGTTYRYHLEDKDTANDIDLFLAGAVTVLFSPNGWYDLSGNGNLNDTQTFTVVDGGYSATNSIKLATLALEGPSLIVKDFGFAMIDDGLGNSNPRLTVMVGLALARAAFDFGNQQTGSGIKAELTDLAGAFEIAVDLDMANLFAMPDISLTGKFMIQVGSVLVEIKDVLEVTGTGISVQYDPNYDPADHNGESQELIRVTSLSVEIIPISLKGALEPYNGKPGLSIRTDGFSLGEAYLQYTDTIDFGTILRIDGIKAGAQDVEVTFGQAFSFNGNVYIAADGAWLFPGGTFEGSITDGPDAGDEAVRATLTFSGNVPDGFLFNADQFAFDFANILIIDGSNFNINTKAADDEVVVSFDALGATLNAGPLSVGGEMRKFGFLGDGSFITYQGFGVFISAEAMTGSSVGWPEWLPIQITEIGIEWDDINANPADFVLTLSASMNGLYGLPLNVSGAVDGIKIDLGLLMDGKFPIVDIGGIAVSVSGDMFGGFVMGGLIGGILKVDVNGNMIGSSDSTTEVHDRVLFMGLQGGFEMPGIGGFSIKFALSELGPLGVFLSATMPAGIQLEPYTGLAIGDFSGGVEFFKSLPSVTNPSELRKIPFGVDPNITADQWLAEVKQQVLNQYNAMGGGDNPLGFLAAFVSPMIITGGGKIFSNYANKNTFNGEVQIQISTDGKFMAAGRLNFAAEMVSITGRIYADVSNVLAGRATVLFLGDIPEQFRFMVVEGKLQLGFEGPDGDPIEFVTVSPADNPYANLYTPANGGEISLNTLNDRDYIDVEFLPSTGAAIDAFSIDGDEFTIDGIDFNGTPELVEDTTNVYRYIFTNDFTPGDYEIVFNAGSWADDSGAQNLAETESFSVAIPGASLASPEDTVSLSVTEINQRGEIVVRFFVPEGTELDTSSIDGGEITLAGPGTSGVSLGSPTAVDGYANTYAYSLSADLQPGEVTVNFVAGSFSDLAGSLNAVDAQTFVVYTTRAELVDPISDATMDVATLNERKYLDVQFLPAVEGGTITDIDGDEFALSGSAMNTAVLVAGAPTVVDAATNKYRYAFTGDLLPGELNLEFAADSWQDGDSNQGIAMTESFTVAGSTMALDGTLNNPLVGLSVLNGEAYIDVRYKATSGASIDGNTIDTNDFTLGGDGLGDAQIDSVEHIGDGVYRYHLIDSDTGNTIGLFQNGALEFDFSANAFNDDANYGNLAETLTVTIVSPTADLYSPGLEEKVFYTDLNEQGYIFVTYTDPTGSGIDEGELDSSDFVLGGIGAENVSLIAGAPTPAKDLLDVLGFDETEYQVDYAAYFGDLNNGEFSTTLETAFGDHSLSIDATSVEVTVIEAGTKWSVDDGTETYILNKVDNAGEDKINITRNNTPEFTYGYKFTGDFQEGLVTVTFMNGGIATNSGATNAEEEEGFTVIGQAYSMELLIEGSVAYFVPFIELELFAIEGSVSLKSELILDAQNNPTEGRMILSAVGSMRMIYLGTVGSAAGKFILSIPVPDNPCSLDNIINGDPDCDLPIPELWGVVNMETNFEKLLPIGIDLDVFSELHLNSTGIEKVETLDLPVHQVDYSDHFGDLDNEDFSQDLKDSFINQRLPGDFDAAIVSVLEEGLKWKISDGIEEYFLEYALNAAGQEKIDVFRRKQYALAPYTFKIESAGKLLLGIPVKNDQGTPDEADDKWEIALELSRLSGAFSMEFCVDLSDMGITGNIGEIISAISDGSAFTGVPEVSLHIFSVGELLLGPDEFDLQFLTISAVGLLLADNDGFAAMMEIGADLDLGPWMKFDGSLHLITNVTSKEKIFRVPERFIEDGYLSDQFIADLEYGPGPLIALVDDSDSSLADQLDLGTLPEPLLDAINKVRDEDLANYSVDESGGAWEVTDNQTGNVLYVIQVNDEDADKLDVLGAPGKKYLRIADGPPQGDGSIGPAAPYFVVYGSGKMLLGIPKSDWSGIDIELSRLSGAFWLSISPEGLQIFSVGELMLGPEEFDVQFLTMNYTGLILVNEDGFAANLEIKADLDLGPWMEFTGSLRMVTNITEKDQLFRVPEMFIQGDYLSQQFIDALVEGPGDLVVRVDDSGSTLSTALNGGSLHADLRTAINENTGDPLGGSVTVTTTADGWTVTDGTDTYYIELNGSNLEVRTAPLMKYLQIDKGAPQGDGSIGPAEPYFVVHGSGKLVIGIPKADKSGIETELARLSGAFFMSISPQGLQIFVIGEMELGPEDFDVQFFNADVLGLILVNNDGFAANLEITSNLDLGPLLQFNSSFQVITNITEQDQLFRVPEMFIQGNYLSQGFIDALEEGPGDLVVRVEDGDEALADELDTGSLPGSLLTAINDNTDTPLGGGITVTTTASGWEVTDGTNTYFIEANDSNLEVRTTPVMKYLRITDGPPQVDGTIDDAAPYLIIQGSGDLVVLPEFNAFVLTGDFRVELTPTHLEMDMKGALAFNVFGVTLLSGTAEGSLTINSAGFLGYVSVTVQAGVPGGFGFDLQGVFQLEINTTGTVKQVERFKIDDHGAPVMVGGEFERELVPVDPGAQLYMGGKMMLGGGALEIVGSMEFTFSKDVVSGKTSAFVVFDAHMSVLGVTLGVNGAAEMFVQPSLGIAIDLALTLASDRLIVPGIGLDINGAFRLRVNTLDQPVTEIGSLDLSADPIPAGPYFRIAVTDKDNPDDPATISLSVGVDITFGAKLLIEIKKENGEQILEVALTDVGIGIGEEYYEFASAFMLISMAGIAIAARIGTDGPQTFTFSGGGNTVILEIDAEITLEINTTGDVINVGDFELAGGSAYAQFGGGGYLKLIFNGQTLFEINGMIELRASDPLEIGVHGLMNLGLLGAFTVDGDLIAGTDGLFAALQMGLDTGNVVDAAGFTLTAWFQLELNLTNNGQTIKRAQIDAQGNIVKDANQDIIYENITIQPWTVRVFAGGVLSIDGFLDFVGGFEFSMKLPDLEINFLAKVEILGAKFSVTGGGGIYANVDTGGIAFALDLEMVAGQSFTDAVGFNFNADFEIEVNSTSIERSYGPNDEIVIDPNTFIIYINGDLDLLGLVVIDGEFWMRIDDTGLDVTMVGSINVPLLGSLSVAGDLRITSAGLVASVQVGGGTNQTLTASGIFSITGRVQFEINTTNSTQNITRLAIDEQTGVVSGLEPGTIARETLRLSIGGDFNILGFVTIKGSIDLVIDSNGFDVDFDAYMDLLAFGKIHVDGGAIISASPAFFAMYLDLGANTLSVDIVDISGNFVLEVNTSSSSQCVGSDLPLCVGGRIISHDTYKVTIDGDLQFWMLQANADFEIGVEGGHFKIAIDVDVNFFDLVTLDVTGYVRSDGDYYFHGEVDIDIPLGPFTLEGGFELTIDDSGMSGRAWGEVNLEIDMPWPFDDIDVTLAGVSGNFEFLAYGIKVAVTVTVVGIDFSGSAEWTWDPPELARKGTGANANTLYLNMGDDAGERGEYFDVDSAESYKVTSAVDIQGRNVTRVHAMGVTKDYLGVNKIVVPNTGVGNDYVFIDNDLLTSVELHGGDGDDFLFVGGTTPAILYGDDGNDKIYGGSNNDYLYGGADNDYLFGGTGTDHLEGGDGNDELEGGDGDDTLLGGEGNDTLNTEGGGTNTLNGGVGVDTLAAGPGDDTFVFAGDWGQDTVTDTGGTNDVYDFGGVTGPVTTTLQSANATSGTNTVTHNSHGIDQIVGSPYNDTFNVITYGTSSIEIDGREGADTYNFHMSSTASGTFTVSDTGNDGSVDELNIFGTANADVLTVSETEFSYANLTANFSGATNLEEMCVELKGGADTLNMLGQPAGLPVVIEAGAGDDIFNLGSSGNLLDAIDSKVTVQAGSGSDTINLADQGDTNNNAGSLSMGLVDGVASGLIDGLGLANEGLVLQQMEALNFNLGSGSDNLTVANTFASMPITIDGNDGNNTITVAETNSELEIDAGAGNDEIEIQLTSALLDINAGDGTNTITVTESSATTRLDIVSGTGNDTILVERTSAALDINAGGGNNTITVYESTATSTLDILSGSGRDDIEVRTSSAAMTINSGGGNDDILVQVASSTLDITAGSGNDTVLLQNLGNQTICQGGSGADVITLDHLPSMDVDAGHTVDINGGGGSDETIVHLALHSRILINIEDSGANDDGVDRLTINGTPNDDLFLLREDFVAIIYRNVDNDGDSYDDYTRINYDQQVNGRLRVNGYGGDDAFFVDDNSTITTLDGGAGDDFFQFGQLFKSARISEDDVNPDYPEYSTGIAAEDAFFTIETTRGFLSNGVSHPLTAYGGSGEDVYQVYHNKAVLRLEGGPDDDTFMVRAFVILDEAAKQAMTYINSGAGYDKIHYVINAPVSIDGGDGYDTVVIVGTEFNDNFVITKDGVYGAGLNVFYENVERIALDGMEGDDQFFIISTSEEWSAILVGNRGSDTFNVAGDVDVDIVSSDLGGASGTITHTIITQDPYYKNTVARDVVMRMLADESSSVYINEYPSTQVDEVVGGGTSSYYDIALSKNAVDTQGTVYLTVSAPISPQEEFDEGGHTIELSTDGISFAKAIVLVFDPNNSEDFDIDGNCVSQRVWVRASNDGFVEGDRYVEVSHNIISGDTTYDGLAIRNVRVRVRDDDRDGLIFDQIDPATGLEDSKTEVYETDDELAVDQYKIRLTHAPQAPVTVSLSLDKDPADFAQVTLSHTTLVFDGSNWDQPVTITVEAAYDEVAEGRQTARILHTMISAGDSDYDGIVENFDVSVFDAANVIIEESNNATFVVAGKTDGTESDTYTVRLSTAPQFIASINVMVNDDDIDNALDPATVEITTDPNNGSITSIDVTNGVITYEPTKDVDGKIQLGEDSFWYKVCDIKGECSDPVEVKINLNPAAENPIAENDGNDPNNPITTDEDVQIVLDKTAILANDTLKGEAPYEIREVTDPKHGATVLVLDRDNDINTISYTPDQDYSGPDHFDYMLCNSNEAADATSTDACSIARIYVTVNAVNDAPIVRDDLAVTEDDGSVTIDVLANDTDVDSTLDFSSLQIVSAPNHGSIADPIVDDEFVYTPTPASGYTGTDTFTYQVCDTDGLCNAVPAQVTVHINGKIIAVDDAITMDEDEAVNGNKIIDVLNNDITPNPIPAPAPNAPKLQIADISQPAHGTATIIQGNATTNDKIQYDPDLNWSGADSFVYKMCNDGGICKSATVSVTVDAVNDDPIARDDLASTVKDTPVTIDVRANDFDIEDDNNLLSPVITGGGPTSGSTEIISGKIKYTPSNADFVGTDSFTYEICDSQNDCSEEVDVNIIVNAASVALDTSSSTNEDTPVDIDVLVNGPEDYNVDEVAAAAHGDVSLDGNTITYSPHAEWYGDDSFIYKICKGGVCDTAKVDLTVSSENDAPMTERDQGVLNDSGVAVIDVLANDVDIDDDRGDLTVNVPDGSGPSYGSTVINPSNGAITYELVLDPGNDDSDTFTYRVCDDDSGCQTAVVDIHINIKLDAVDDGDVDNPITTDEDTTVDVSVLANDEHNSNALVIGAITEPEFGITTDNGDGTITYEPYANWSSEDITDSFTYLVCDAGGICDTATVTVEVIPINDQPEAKMDLVVIENTVLIDVATSDPAIHVVAESPAISDNPSRLIFNAENWDKPQTVIVTAVSTPQGDPTIMHFASTSHTVEGLKDAGGINGPIEIAGGLVEAGDIALGPAIMLPYETNYYVPTGTVDEVDDTSVVYGDSEIDADLSNYADKGIMYLAILDSDTKEAFDIRKIAGYQLISVISYAPDNEYTGSDTFDYSVCDLGDDPNDQQDDACGTGTVNLWVNSGQALEIQDVLLTPDEDVPATHTVQNPLTVDDYTQPNYGIVTLDGNTFTYTPDVDSTLDDYFTYMACDGSTCGIAKVQIDITPVNDVPIARDDLVGTTDGQDVIVDVLANDLDIERKLDRSSISINANPDHGTVTLLPSLDSPDGRIKYSPVDGYAGLDTFGYQVCDDVDDVTVHCPIAWVTVNVQPDADPNVPTAIDDSFSVDEDTPTVIAVADNDRYIGLDAYIPSMVTEAEYGEVVLANGTITYTPDAEFNGVDYFSYMLCHPTLGTTGLCDIAEVRVQVEPVNDAPVPRKVLAVGTKNSPIEIPIPVNNIDLDDNLDFDSVETAQSRAGHGSLTILPDKITELNLVADTCEDEGIDTPWCTEHVFYTDKDFVVFFASPTLFVDEATQTDVLNINNDHSDKDYKGLLTDSLIAGLGMVEVTDPVSEFDPDNNVYPKGITYSGLEEINLLLGRDNDDFTVHSSAAGTVTHIIDDIGEDTFTILSADGELVIQAGVENDTFNLEIVTDAPAIVSLNGGDDDDTFNVLSGNDAPNIDLHMRGGVGDDIWTLSDNVALGSATNVGAVPMIDG
ncbi:MAG: tandem-95 repeat protein, partial [Chloroflexi bacterium]|nr:tandem-95 repeat protein [Chloroflexota bacterium]